MTRTWSVREIGEHIDRKISEEWSSAFWVRGEVKGISRTAYGRLFFDLVDTDERGNVSATLKATVSRDTARLIDRRLKAAGQPLSDGLEVRLKARLDYWVPGGRLSIAVRDIDTEHTAGALALARRDLLIALEAEGIMNLNAALPTPRLPLRLGLITRGGSDAYHDLLHELRASGHPFAVSLVSCAVQGAGAAEELRAAVARLSRPEALVDLVLVTRGGGSDLDLLTFDHEGLARDICACPVPVWAGIGHQLDSPVAELVAARAYKTPTALAQGVVSAVRDAVGATETTWEGIRRLAQRRLADADTTLGAAERRVIGAKVLLRGIHTRLDGHAHRLAVAAGHGMQRRRVALDGSGMRLDTAARAIVRRADQRLGHVATLIEASDPERLIARGWSVTTDTDGALVTGPVPAGTRLHTRTRGGRITSEVIDDQ